MPPLCLRLARVARAGEIMPEYPLTWPGRSKRPYGPSDEQESRATLRRSVELGVTLLDAAESYGLGNHERLAGRALAPYRDHVSTATKVGFGCTEDGRMAVVDGRPAVDGRPEHIVHMAARSRRLLAAVVLCPPRSFVLVRC